jgi:hypothetical protein
MAVPVRMRLDLAAERIERPRDDALKLGMRHVGPGIDHRDPDLLAAYQLVRILERELFDDILRLQLALRRDGDQRLDRRQVRNRDDRSRLVRLRRRHLGRRQCRASRLGCVLRPPPAAMCRDNSAGRWPLGWSRAISARTVRALRPPSSRARMMVDAREIEPPARHERRAMATQDGIGLGIRRKLEQDLLAHQPVFARAAARSRSAGAAPDVRCGAAARRVEERHDGCGPAAGLAHRWRRARFLRRTGASSS